MASKSPKLPPEVTSDVVVPATRPDCDAGFIIMEPEDTPPMSGSNSICVATVLLDAGSFDQVCHAPRHRLGRQLILRSHQPLAIRHAVGTGVIAG